MLEMVEKDSQTDENTKFHFIDDTVTTVKLLGPVNGDQPLDPQPSSDPADPLNWSGTWKHIVLLQVALGSMMSTFTSGSILPGLGQLAKEYHITVNTATYLLSGHIVGVGIGNVFWTPLSNTYGRRSCYLAAAFITLVADLGGCFAKSYADLMVSRVFQGFGSGAPNTMAAASIADLFFLHERGAKTGVWIYFTTMGPYLGPILNGFLIQAKGWRWSLYLTTIIKAFLFLFMIPFLPEHLYIRSNEATSAGAGKTNPASKFSSKSELANLHLIRYNLTQGLFKRIGPPVTVREFLQSFETLRYPSVALLALPITFGIAFADYGVTSIIPQVFPQLYGFNSQQQGLTYFGFLIGALIGEAMAGKLSDIIVVRRTKANKDVFEPEMRLTVLPLAIFFLTVGMVLWGIFVDIPTPWIGPVFVGGLAICGVQMLTTVGMAYVIDCYSPGPRAAAGPSIIFFCRQVLSLAIPFFNVPAAHEIGFTKWFIIQAAVIVASSIGSILLLWWGKRLRELYG